MRASSHAPPTAPGMVQAASLWGCKDGCPGSYTSCTCCHWWAFNCWSSRKVDKVVCKDKKCKKKTYKYGESCTDTDHSVSWLPVIHAAKFQNVTAKHAFSEASDQLPRGPSVLPAEWYCECWP